MASELESEEVPTVGGTMVMMPEHEPAPELAPLAKPDGDGVIVALKDSEGGWDLHELEGPVESVARHVFDSLDDFAAWVKRWTPNPEACQILANLPVSLDDANPKKTVGSVSARIDPRDANGDRVTCQVDLDPVFSAWLEGTRDPMTQRDAFAFLRAHGDVIEGEHTAQTFLGALATLKIKGSTEVEAQFAPNGMIRVAASGGGVELSQDIPSEIKIRVPVYRGVRDQVGVLPKSYSIRVLVLVDANPAGLFIRFEMPTLARTLIDANADLVKHLTRELDEPFLVGVGRDECKEVPVNEKRVGWPCGLPE